MDRAVADAIRQQSDDLRDELKALEEWQDTVARSAAAVAKRRQLLQQQQAKNTDNGRDAAGAATAVASTSSLPDTTQMPIRGTVPSIKEVVARRTGGNGADAQGAGKSRAATNVHDDPVQRAKERGNEYFRVGQMRDALHAYTTGIDLDPDGAATALLYANRAACHLKLQQWASAEADATRCLELQRGYAKAYYRRAMARKQLGKLKDARVDLEAVLALSPGDASALAEMEHVTRQLQAQRAATAASADGAASGATRTAAGKRVVIEEVEDDEEAEGAAELGSEHDEATRAAADGASAVDAQQRACRLAEQEAALHAVRAQQATAAHERAAKQARVLEATLRRSARVEVVEESDGGDDDEKARRATTTSKAPTATTSAAAAAAAAATGVTGHVTPATQPSSATTSTTAATTAAATARAAAGAATMTTPNATAAADANKSAPAVPPIVRARPAASTLTAPRSFAELERFVAAWAADDELRNHYIALVDPAALRTLIGSNLTPEVLMALLATVRQVAGATAVRLLSGIVAVARVDDVALFLSSDERRQVDETLRVAEQAGATTAQMALFRRKLRRL